MLINSKEKKKIVNGIIWISIAASNGHKLASEEIESISPQLDAIELEFIEKSARFCSRNSYQNCP
jgi:hypothetical protein